MRQVDIENWIARFKQAVSNNQAFPWFDEGKTIGYITDAKPDLKNGRILTVIKLNNGDILQGSIS